MPEIDSLIQKYLHGETSEAENQQLHQWIHESPENEKHFFPRSRAVISRGLKKVIPYFYASSVITF